MKKIYVVCALAGAILSLGGCIEENFEDTIKVTKGDEVVFNASANFEKSGAETRTEYSGDGDGDFERVNWMTGDQVYIFCDHVDGDQEAHYFIDAVDAETSGSNTHRATLKKNSKYNPNGIIWQDTKEKTHTFYAVYPAPNTFLIDTDEQGKSTYSAHLSLAENKVEGFIPVNQDPIAWSGGKGKPNMDYAYMIAKQEVTGNADGKVASVNLQFRPIVTAVEFTLTAAEETEISTVQIFSNDGKPICGPFNSDLSEYNPAGSYPACTVGSLDDQRYTGLDFSQINVSLYEMDGEGKPTSASLTLSANSSLTFTVFMLPVDIDSLSIRVNAHDVYKTAELGVSFAAHKKHFVKNLALPSKPVDEVDPNNWISQLNPATMVGGLSIPGSANSFSYAYSETVDPNYMTQSLTFEEQWALGVRCFELVSTRTAAGFLRPGSSLASAPLRCNSRDLGTTVDEAVQKIWDKVKSNPKEFAMVIFTYQPVALSWGDLSPILYTRDAESYMSQLITYYKALKDAKVATQLYKPGLAIGQCQGKLLIVARPSQEGEDASTAVNNAVGEGDILTVKGWGSLQDKWYKRGYNYRLYSGDDGSKVSYDNYPSSYVEDYIYEGVGETAPKRSNGNQRFVYTSDQGFEVWAQEWRRVAQATHTYTNNTRWFESYESKVEDFLDTYERSISREGDRVYFNSLDGFFIIDDSESYGDYPNGNMGDIKTFAEKINDEVSKEILARGAANGTGPMGVVIMDYVGTGDGGTELPKVIIDNNFKSPPPIDPSYKDE